MLNTGGLQRSPECRLLGNDHNDWHGVITAFKNQEQFRFLIIVTVPGIPIPRLLTLGLQSGRAGLSTSDTGNRLNEGRRQMS